MSDNKAPAERLRQIAETIDDWVHAIANELDLETQAKQALQVRVALLEEILQEWLNLYKYMDADWAVEATTRAVLAEGGGDAD